MRKWTIEDSAELYNIKGWGVGYFDVNKKGNVVVSPQKKGDGVELLEKAGIETVYIPVEKLNS